MNKAKKYNYILNKYMKLTIVVFFISCIYSNIFGQEKDSLINKKNRDSIILQAKRDSLNKIIISEKWDTLRFNPYGNQFKKYPFKIHFIDSTYASPIARKKVITSRYGWRKGRPHNGIDIDLVTGDNVMAMFDGVIRFVSYSSGHGKTIVIRHYNGLETAYAHLSKYVVKINDSVKKGQIIGLGGTTGNARGSHLHLTVSYKGNYINPDYLFDFGKENIIREQSLWINKYWVTAYFHSSKKQSNLVFYNSYEEALASQKKQNKRKIYTIKRGDTLSEIANKYRVSLAKICEINAISKNSILKIGKRLIIN